MSRDFWPQIGGPCNQIPDRTIPFLYGHQSTHSIGKRSPHRLKISSISDFSIKAPFSLIYTILYFENLVDI
jgi:hypothetical protein